MHGEHVAELHTACDKLLSPSTNASDTLLTFRGSAKETLPGFRLLSHVPSQTKTEANRV